MRRLILLAALAAFCRPAEAMSYAVDKVRTSAGREVNVVRMAGLIGNGDWSGWADAVSRVDPALDTLFVVSSPGGMVPGGFFLVGKVEDYLAARAAAGRRDWILADRDCSSMCVPFYFLFEKRLTRPDARFGLHGVAALGGFADDPGQTDLYLGLLTKAARRRGETAFLAWLDGMKAKGVFSTHELTPLPGRTLVQDGSGLVSPDGLAADEREAIERLDAGR